MTYRVAIVGIGTVAIDNYIPFLAEQTDLELAYQNRNADSARRVAEVHPGTVLETIDDVVSWAPDIAFVLTSERVRLPLAQRLIDAGVPRLYLEKPLTAAAGQANVSEEDFLGARRLLASASAAGVEVAMNFNYRSFALYERLLELVKNDELGSLSTLVARAHFACWSHCIDLIGLFAGPVASVSAVEGAITRAGAGMEAVDVAIAFRAASGAIGSLLGSAGSPWEHPLLELSLEFERGRVVVSDLDGSMAVYRRGEPYVESIHLGGDTSRWARYSESFRSALNAYLTSVRSESAPPVPALAGLQELQFEAAVRRSARTEQQVQVRQVFPI